MNEYLWPKILTLFFSSLYLLNTSKQKKIKQLRFFSLIITVYFIRDFLFRITQNNDFVVLSDILIASIFLLWLKTHVKFYKVDYVFFIVNAIVVLLSVANILFNFYGKNYNIIILMARVSPYNTENSDVIIQSKYIIFFAYLILYFFHFFLASHTRLIHFIILPLSYFIIFYFINIYNNIILEEKKNIIYQYSSELESLFSFMKNFGGVISDKLDLDSALKLIVDSAVTNTNAEAGAILLVDDYEHKLVVKSVNGYFPPVYRTGDMVKTKLTTLQSYFFNTRIEIGETILGEPAKTGKSIYIRNNINDERLPFNQSDDLLFISSLIVIPLIVSNRVIGVIATVNKTKSNLFSEKDYNHLETYASYISIYIDNMRSYIEILEKKELQKELGVAAQIQKRLQPMTLPEFDNFKIAALSKPAKGVSGDYYDVIKIDDDRVAVIICDVAGKGVPAAMVMIMIRTILHLIISSKNEPAGILNWINQGLVGNIEIDSFATMSILVFDQKINEVTYSNAAHLPLLYYNSEKKSFFKIDTNGLPIGIEKKSDYNQKRFKMNGNDLLILYTDGIIEAMNKDGEQYSKKSLLQIIQNNSRIDAKELVNAVSDDLESFVGNANQHDDQTLLILKVN